MRVIPAIFGAAVLMGLAALAIGPEEDLAKEIASDAKAISIEGVLHVDNVFGVARMDRIDGSRFSDPDFRMAKDVANTQTGVRVTFRTNSPKTKIICKEREDGRKRETTYYFGVYCDGRFIGDIPGTDPVITAPRSGMHDYTVVFPIMYSVDFCGIRVGTYSSTRKARTSFKPVYVAIGDSITHGTGQVQHGSQISYPYIIAENHGWNLYNLAVGGSKITPKVACELEDIKVDVITIMWGYNDWNQTKGDLQEISRRYHDLLENLTAVQPRAEIWCILPSTARNEVKPGYSGSLPDVREAERTVIEEFMKTRAGKHLHIIEGNAHSTGNDLVDGVHFSNEGAGRFAEAISPIVSL